MTGWKRWDFRAMTIMLSISLVQSLAHKTPPLCHLWYYYQTDPMYTVWWRMVAGATRAGGHTKGRGGLLGSHYLTQGITLSLVPPQCTYPPVPRVQYPSVTPPTPWTRMTWLLIVFHCLSPVYLYLFTECCMSALHAPCDVGGADMYFLTFLDMILSGNVQNALSHIVHYYVRNTGSNYRIKLSWKKFQKKNCWCGNYIDCQLLTRLECSQKLLKNAIQFIKLKINYMWTKCNTILYTRV